MSTEVMVENLNVEMHVELEASIKSVDEDLEKSKLTSRFSNI
jgi:hypothetical protein